MKSLKVARVLNWTVATAVIAALLWFGYGPDHVQGARNVFVFFVWATMVLYFMAFGIDKVRADLGRLGSPVPEALTITVNLIFIVFLVWQGSWFMGALYLLRAGMLGALRTPSEESA